HWATNPGVGNHDHRVSDPDFGWTVLPIFARCAEYMLEKLYKLFCVVNHNSRGNGMPTCRNELRILGSFCHRSISWRVRFKRLLDCALWIIFNGSRTTIHGLPFTCFPIPSLPLIGPHQECDLFYPIPNSVVFIFILLFFNETASK